MVGRLLVGCLSRAAGSAALAAPPGRFLARTGASAPARSRSGAGRASSKKKSQRAERRSARKSAFAGARLALLAWLGWEDDPGVQLGGIGGYHDVAGLSRPVGGEVPLDGHGPAGGTQFEKLVFLGAGGTGAGVLVDMGDLDAGVSLKGTETRDRR